MFEKLSKIDEKCRIEDLIVQNKLAQDLGKNGTKEEDIPLTTPETVVHSKSTSELSLEPADDNAKEVMNKCSGDANSDEAEKENRLNTAKEVTNYPLKVLSLEAVNIYYSPIQSKFS